MRETKNTLSEQNVKKGKTKHGDEYNNTMVRRDA